MLGASIGGPEAVRDFLAELPRDYPALFLLAQHMGAEFVDLMAQQLAKATPLTVRTPTHGERVGHGEVVIVPTTHRLQVDAEGVVLLERASNDGAYSPSIDRVLRDVADRYGANAGAIIFSGMTTDAVEGAKYLAAKGGAIYAQHPDTCVVSSMIDGVVEAGIVKVLGAPKELADIVNAESSQAQALSRRTNLGNAMPDLPREIRGVMIPVTGGRVLLPNATVAEVITYAQPERIANAPHWLLGRLSWRGWRLPLFSFPMLTGEVADETYTNARVAVLKALSGNAKMPFLALLAQGFPRLTTITPDSLIPTGDENAHPLGIRAEVLVRDDRAVIPDLGLIEGMVAEAVAA